MDYLYGLYHLCTLRRLETFECTGNVYNDTRDYGERNTYAGCAECAYLQRGEPNDSSNGWERAPFRASYCKPGANRLPLYLNYTIKRAKVKRNIEKIVYTFCNDCRGPSVGCRWRPLYGERSPGTRPACARIAARLGRLDR